MSVWVLRSGGKDRFPKAREITCGHACEFFLASRVTRQARGNRNGKLGLAKLTGGNQERKQTFPRINFTIRSLELSLKYAKRFSPFFDDSSTLFSNLPQKINLEITLRISTIFEYFPSFPPWLFPTIGEDQFTSKRILRKDLNLDLNSNELWVFERWPK